MSQRPTAGRPRPGGTFRGLLAFSFAWAAALASAHATAADPHPLKPADTSSPQATLQSFLDNTNQAYRLIARQAGKPDPGDTSAYRLRATRCLDSSKIAPTAAEDVADRRAVLLSEIFDRIPLPDPKDAPDAQEVSAKKITRWRVPNTEIAIVQVADGPRQGEFLFSADTVARVPEFYERVKHLPYRPGTVLPNAYAKLFTSGQPAPQADDPLKPADTSSPQATLKSFIDSMNALYRAYKAEGPGGRGRDARRAPLGRALRCLNVSKVPPKALQETEHQAAVLLMEVFDRVKVPPYEAVPGAPEVRKDDVTSWTVPNTEITIARVEEGPRKGEFLFTPETVSRARSFYDQVAHLPYKDGTVLPDAYNLYLQSPGPAIPVSWVLALPPWLKAVVLGQPVWKWVAALVVLVLLLAGLALAFRAGVVRRLGGGEPASFRRRLLFPLSALCMTYLAEAAVKQLRPVQEVALLASVVSTLLIAASLAWLIGIVVNALAEAVVRSPRVNAREIDAHLVRIAFRLVTLAAFVAIVILTADNLGVPLTPVLAGLGVGGVAVALAAQNSVENLLGGLNLFMDRPVRVGDFCRFGDRVGTVEEIGLRSTRVRTLDDTVVAVPNAAFSKLELENYSRRRKFWYHPRLQLEKTSSADQVRFVLVEVRKMLYSHPKVDPDPARIRFAEFAPSSLELDVFAYVTVTDPGEYLEVAEDLNLRILEVLARGGLRLAVPAQRTLVEPGQHPDPERAEQTEKQVQSWREHQQLYLPSFPEEVVSQLRASLDYPPRGAPAAGPQPAPANDLVPAGRPPS
jgi:MscS family membrane protein